MREGVRRECAAAEGSIAHARGREDGVLGVLDASLDTLAPAQGQAEVNGRLERIVSSFLERVVVERDRGLWGRLDAG